MRSLHIRSTRCRTGWSRVRVDVDRIYVLRDGRIVESAGYRELLERDGVMADMARRQLI